MSPEQAEGQLDRLGPASDVYSLGATLYYLLTGRPPVAGDAAEVIRAVQRGEFPPPRQVDPTLDRALEAVCLQAMAHKPADRYATPRALAEDVERWMADEPVSTWREPLSRRARRWARRNRTAVAMVAAALIAGVIGLSAVLVVQARAKADIARALRRETSANAALVAAYDELGRSRAAVQARYELAAEAIKTFHTGVLEDFLLKEETFKEVRDRLLKSSADFYGRLGALLGRETDPAARRALAAANFELAELTAKVGRPEEALAAHRAALAAREALAAEPGADAGVTVEVGRSLTAAAGLLYATGKTDEALAAYRHSEALLAGPAGSDAAALAACRSLLGQLLSATGQTDAALAAYRQARADQEALAAAPGASAEARRDLADTINRIGARLEATGKMAEAEAEYRTALALRRKLAEDHPAVAEFRRDLAYSHWQLGWRLLQSSRAAEAEAEYRAGTALQRQLAEDHPAVTEFRSDLAGGHHGLGYLLTEMGKPAAAEAEYRTALALRQKLAGDHPTVTVFRSNLAGSHTMLGELLGDTGRPAAAEAEFRKGLVLECKLAEDNPKVPGFRKNVADSQIYLSVVVRRLGRPAESRDLCQSAIAALEALIREDPKRLSYREALAESYLYRGLARRALGDPAGATADAQQALDLFKGLTSFHKWVWYGAACCHAALAGLTGPAAAEADTAMALLHRAVAEGYRHAALFRTDDALDPLRGREDFRRLLMDLAFPAEPFATAR
jgi:serine/threonine-protein kinase